MESHCTLVTGGARSGKSAFAEARATRLSNESGLPVTYLATAEVSDAEMAERIARHQSSRPQQWQTVEAPLQAAAWLARHPDDSIVLLDCLSLLLNNWMFLDGCTEAEFLARRDELIAALNARTQPTIIVTNEVGLGIVPTGAAVRQYRDWLGWLNQAVAAVSASVVLVTSGIAVDLRQWQVTP